MNMKCVAIISALMFTCNAEDIFAGSVDIPNNFAPSGAAAMASDVYANFNAVETAIDDNDRRIVNIETNIANLQSRASSFQTMDDTDQATIRKLQFEVDSLQKTVNNQQSTITSLQSAIDSFRNKDKAQQEKIADLTNRLETLEKKDVHN